MDNIIKIFVGADRSQALAIKVLEHSIKRHSCMAIEVYSMIDLDVPVPKNPRNSQRTGFSFSRFCIPKLNSYSGKAIYMDADMLVFKDIKQLWDVDLKGAQISIQSNVDNMPLVPDRSGGLKKRIKQCAVMVIDCNKAKWDIQDIVNSLDAGEYDYENLMYQMCIIPEEEINYTVPPEWNSLEYYDSNTCNLHYTDMGTQPWVSTRNINGDLWLNEVRLMLKSGAVSIEDIKKEIGLGYFRPSLIRDLYFGEAIPKPLKRIFNWINQFTDFLSGFKAHKKVYELKRMRDKDIEQFTKKAHS